MAGSSGGSTLGLSEALGKSRSVNLRRLATLGICIVFCSLYGSTKAEESDIDDEKKVFCYHSLSSNTSIYDYWIKVRILFQLIYWFKVLSVYLFRVIKCYI